MNATRVIREYVCDCCHHDFEGRENADDEPIKHCPFCQHETVQLINETEERKKWPNQQEGWPLWAI